MTAKDAIKQIKVMLGVDVPVETAETETVLEDATELASAKLVDGTEVYCENDFAEGEQLFVVTEEEKVPAPEGKHELEDGRIISVDAEGKIMSVEAKVEEEESVTEEAEFKTETEVEEVASVTLSNELVDSLISKLDSLNDSIAELENRIELTNEEFHTFKNEPAAGKITNNLGQTQKNEGELADARYAKLAQFRSEVRNNNKF